MNTERSTDKALANLGKLLPDLEALYTDVHAHPELSMQENRTSVLAAERLRAAGYEVTTGVGKTGVVGLLRNGPGQTVMLRADMDALPVEEMTGLPYASKVRSEDRDGHNVPVMHACGHDMHVAWLVGASTLLAQARDSWSGTLMAVFQPAEETAEGARVRKRVLAAIERIVNAEAVASGAPKPPEITPLDSYPMGVNDGGASERVGNAFREYFPAERVRQTGPTSASEDFGSFGTEWHVPAVFWFVGGTDPDTYAKAKAAGEVNKIPSNHSPFFAPVLHPTLETGVQTLVAAALAWLSSDTAAAQAQAGA
jgi:metal-dependent amidase/aminoacylase/carboxypeptidase family protein